MNSYLNDLDKRGRWDAMARRWFGDRAPLPSPQGHRPEQRGTR
jgi:hypothetical protein